LLERSQTRPKVVHKDAKWARKSMDSIRESAPKVVRKDAEWNQIDGF
jgi:hypothetical protein